MNAQTQTAAAAPAKLPEPPAQRRLIGLVLFEASRFNHSDSITTKPTPGSNGAETRIVPARLGSDGDWAPCSDKERPDGFGLEQHRGSGKDRKLCRGFILLSGVKELMYGE